MRKKNISNLYDVSESFQQQLRRSRLGQTDRRKRNLRLLGVGVAVATAVIRRVRKFRRSKAA